MEKSSIQEKEEWNSLDYVTNNLRKHSDSICGVGCGVLVFTLIAIIYSIIIL